LLKFNKLLFYKLVSKLSVVFGLFFVFCGFTQLTASWLLMIWLLAFGFECFYVGMIIDIEVYNRKHDKR
jgi:hypothetical protein